MANVALVAFGTEISDHEVMQGSDVSVSALSDNATCRARADAARSVRQIDRRLDRTPGDMVTPVTAVIE